MRKRSLGIVIILMTLNLSILSAESNILYVINLSNDIELFAREITFNERFESLSFKSLRTGLNSTIPLNRILSIDMATKGIGALEIADAITTKQIFENEQSILNRIDDGGTPCNFVVVTDSVSSSARNVGAASGKATSSRKSGNSSYGSGSKSSSSRSNSGYSSNSNFSGSGFSTSGSNRSSGSSWSSGSDSSADAFMDIFFR